MKRLEKGEEKKKMETKNYIRTGKQTINKNRRYIGKSI